MNTFDVEQAGSEPLLGSVSWRSAFVTSVLVSLGRPELWPVALAGFLLRGGLLAFLLPVMVLPTVIGLADFVGPLAITPSGPSVGFIQLLATIGAVVVTWLVVAGIGGALVDAFLVRSAVLDDLSPSDTRSARDEGPAEHQLAAHERKGSVGTDWRRQLIRLLVVRVVSLLPVGVALVWALPSLIEATYLELTSPTALQMPVPIRVLQDQPGSSLAILGAWLLGECLSSLATRRVVLAGSTAHRALAGSLLDLVRRPITTTLTGSLSFGLSLLAVGPSVLAAAIAWSRLRVLLVGDGDLLGIALAAPLFVAIWGGGLVLAGLAGTWRSIFWTYEIARLSARPAVSEDLGVEDDQLTEAPAQ